MDLKRAAAKQSFCCSPFGADGGGRTHTVSLPRDFESRTSANSITSAIIHTIILQITLKINTFLKKYYNHLIYLFI